MSSKAVRSVPTATMACYQDLNDFDGNIVSTHAIYSYTFDLIFIDRKVWLAFILV